MTTHAEELARTIDSDPVFSVGEHAATIKLTRDLADELDAQIASGGPAQTRTIATYAGLLGNLRRIARDERERRRRDQVQATRPASRIAQIKQQVRETTAVTA